MNSYTSGEEIRNAIAYATSALHAAIDVETQEPTHRGQTIAAMGVAAGTLQVVFATYDTTGEQNQQQPDLRPTRGEGLDWKALAACVKARRNWLGMSQPDVFKAGGPGEQTMLRIENFRRSRYDAATLARLEKALGWKPGTVATILNGTADRRLTIGGDQKGTPTE